jgi:Peptidase family M20/M25/M40
VNENRLLVAVESKRAAALVTHRFVHEHPEISHAEHRCARHITEVLAAAGHQVERGIVGMETAFKATLTGALPGRSVGLICLYDAVPVFRADGSIEPVHSCGHDAIAGGVVATGLALADLRDELPGKLVVFGCPGDEIPAPLTVERGGGKAVSAAAGEWDDIDAALYAHPEFEDTVFLESRWMRRDRAMITGTRSLQGSRRRRSRRWPLRSPPSRSCRRRTRSSSKSNSRATSRKGGGLYVRIHFLLRSDEEAGLDELAALLRHALPARSGRVIRSSAGSGRTKR